MVIKMNDRVILHCDLNAFFASVECLDKPHLKNVPMAVAGNIEDRHGIILAKNEIAKKYNIKTAETIWQAKLKCPNLVIVPPHHEKYVKYSRIINDIYKNYTDLVEPFSIDECWLDVTGSRMLFGDGLEIAQKISNEVKNKTGLTLSIGVSFNKIFAKIGSDYKKPDAITIISRENYKDIVFPLSASNMLFVGKSTLKQFEKVGIKTIGDIANSSKESLVTLLGKMGETLWIYANGLDDSKVENTRQKEKSIGNGHTFKRNLIGKDDIKQALTMLCDTVSTRLRKKNLKCRTICVTIKTPELKSVSRRQKIPYFSNTEHDIFGTSYKIMCENWNFNNPIRMLTITATDFEGEESFLPQLNMFDEEKQVNEKFENFDKSMDIIREKFGDKAIQFASGLNSDIISQHKEDENEN